MSTSKARPSYEAFLVDGEGNGANWTKVGAAWPHEDGKGLNITLTPGLSVHGKIVLRSLDPTSRQKPK